MGLLTRHYCETPLRLPVVEEQRIWTCPDCSVQWRWDVIGHDAIGWVRIEPEPPKPTINTRFIKCDAADCIRCRGSWGVSETPYPEGWGPKARPDETHPWYRWVTRWWHRQWR